MTKPTVGAVGRVGSRWPSWWVLASGLSKSYATQDSWGKAKLTLLVYFIRGVAGFHHFGLRQLLARIEICEPLTTTPN
jgi:hypothetical protein